jgi:hypothetical protein
MGKEEVLNSQSLGQELGEKQVPSKKVAVSPLLEELVRDLARKTRTDPFVLRNIVFVIGIRTLAEIINNAKKDDRAVLLSIKDIIMAYAKAREIIDSLPEGLPPLTGLDRMPFIVKEREIVFGVRDG